MEEQTRQADLIIRNAAELLTCQSAGPKRGEQLRDPGCVADGALAVREGRIVFVGRTDDLDWEARDVLDATGKVVLPGFVDCHTHLVFAGSREHDLERRLRGDSYLEILEQGGGILSTVEQTRAATEEGLFQRGLERLDSMLAHGTTTVEIKSGYGLNLETEQKILRVARRLDREHPVDVVTTYLGAHTTQKEKEKEAYLEEVVASLEEMRPLAEFCDVFCEEGAFSHEEARRVLEAARARGFRLKIHAEQMHDLRGAQLAAELGAVSADHLDHISQAGIERLAASKTIGVLLPGASFYLMTEPYAPARRMIEQGVALALATDFNPGSCPCENMQLILTLACLQMRLLPAEAINCATINAAHALNLGDRVGSLEIGKQADVLILDAGNHQTLPYHFGGNRVETVVKKGRVALKAHPRTPAARNVTTAQAR